MLNREVLIRVYDERKCLCGILFYVPKKGARIGRRPSYVRKRDCYSCSQKCTKENRKTREKINNRIQREKAKLKTGAKNVDSK